MSNAKHTTGPWKVEKELTARSWQWLIAMDAGERGRGIGIAETLPTRGGGAELANALLIAAAPELLEACEAFIAAEGVLNIVAAHSMARAAIAKATGSESSDALAAQGMKP